MAQRPLNPAQQLEGGARRFQGLVGRRTPRRVTSAFDPGGDGSGPAGPRSLRDCARRRAPSRAAMLRRFWVDANQAFHEAGARGSGL